VELASGRVGYVPAKEALGATGGACETRLTAYSNLEPTAGGQIRYACVELASPLKPGEVPKLSKALPFKELWLCGNAPAELACD
jgi:hypothetical protein